MEKKVLLILVFSSLCLSSRATEFEEGVNDARKSALKIFGEMVKRVERKVKRDGYFKNQEEFKQYVSGILSGKTLLEKIIEIDQEHMKIAEELKTMGNLKNKDKLKSILDRQIQVLRKLEIYESSLQGKNKGQDVVVL